MLDEFLVVLAYSKSTQLLLVLGVLFFVGFMIGGAYVESHFVLKSVSWSASDAIRDLLVQRYDKAAWGVLFASWAAAVKCYLKARKRLFNSI